MGVHEFSIGICFLFYLFFFLYLFIYLFISSFRLFFIDSINCFHKALVPTYLLYLNIT